MKDYIAVDWGSTQLRGWLIRNGQCVGRSSCRWASPA
jgi:2-dehydro-3-deoxygalactonokinase